MSVVYTPSVIHALSVKIRGKALVIRLSPSAEVTIDIASLREPWTSASKKAVENVRLDLGGSWIFWDDLDEGIELDEWLPYVLNMDPAKLLGARNHGKKASFAKARAARKNGKKGGRPKKSLVGVAK
ncbi:MAG: hypothetical protein JO199_07655 [Candidatus Eremiobacteraeota bacterium]|nr:hypothetical protein [Candidatus Eremiobacteraeota bacterium]